jgi:hypothetical protein
MALSKVSQRHPYFDREFKVVMAFSRERELEFQTAMAAAALILVARPRLALVTPRVKPMRPVAFAEARAAD